MFKSLNTLLLCSALVLTSVSAFADKAEDTLEKGLEAAGKSKLSSKSLRQEFCQQGDSQQGIVSVRSLEGRLCKSSVVAAFAALACGGMSGEKDNEGNILKGSKTEEALNAIDADSTQLKNTIRALEKKIVTLEAKKNPTEKDKEDLAQAEADLKVAEKYMSVFNDELDELKAGKIGYQGFNASSCVQEIYNGAETNRLCEVWSNNDFTMKKSKWILFSSETQVKVCLKWNYKAAATLLKDKVKSGIKKAMCSDVLRPKLEGIDSLKGPLQESCPKN